MLWEKGLVSVDSPLGGEEKEMGSCCRTDADEMSARLFWGGCGWNELLEEPGDRKPRLGWLRCRIARAVGAEQLREMGWRRP